MRVIARVLEQENVKLVRASGADVIVSPPRFGGYLMADAVDSHGTVDFVSELLSFRGDYQLQERERRADEIGRAARDLEESLVVEVRRGGARHRLLVRQGPGDRAGRPAAGDRLPTHALARPA